MNKKKDKVFHKQFFLFFLIGIVVNILAVVLTKMLYVNMNFALVVWINRNIPILDLYLTQISVTFIVVSLISVFSSKSEPIYWTDIISVQLVEPPVFNFISLSAYIFSSLAISTFFAVCNSRCLYVSFGTSLILMSILSYKMIVAYFGRQYIKQKLQKTYCNENDEEKHAEKRNLLLESSFQAVSSNSIEQVKENLKLFIDANDTESYISVIKYCVESHPELSSVIVKTFPHMPQEKEVFRWYIEVIDRFIRKGSAEWNYIPFMRAVIDAYQKQLTDAYTLFISDRTEINRIERNAKKGFISDDQANRLIEQEFDSFLKEKQIRVFFPDAIIPLLIQENYRGLSEYLRLRYIMNVHMYDELFHDGADYSYRALFSYIQLPNNYRNEMEKFIEYQYKTQSNFDYRIEFDIISLYGVPEQAETSWSLMGKHRSEKIVEGYMNLPDIYHKKGVNYIKYGKIV